MADIQFQYPVKSMAGSVSHDKSVSFRTRYGKTHAYHFRNPSTEPDSEVRKAHRQNFGEARREAFAQLQDPQKKTEWLKLFKKQKKYVRLDCFVTAQLLQTIKEKEK